MEIELQESEAKFSMEKELLKEKTFSDVSINSLPGIFYLFDEKKRFLRWNMNFNVVTGYSDEEISAMHPLDLFKGEEKDRVGKAIREVFSTGESSVEAHLISKNGTEIPYYFTGRLFILDNQKYLTGMGIDFSQLRKAETALRASESRYRKLHESMMDGFVYVDMEGAVRDCNESYQKMLGYSFDDLSKLTYMDLTPEKWHAFEKRIVEEQILPKGFSDVYEKEYRRKDGEIFPVEIRTFLVKNEAGENEGMWAIVRDITKRKHIELEMAMSAREWQATFDATNDAIWILDCDQRVMRSNKAAGQYFNLPNDQMIGRRCWEIAHGTNRPIDECPIMKTRETLRRANIEVQIGKDWFVITVDPIVNDAGRFSGSIHNVRNITERKELQSQLIQAQKMESVGRLAGGVAHDFNNMLGVITGNAELAIAETTPGSAQHEYLKEILNAARRSTDITRQMLAFARRQTINPRALDLNQSVGGMIKMLRRLIGEDITLSWQPGFDLWPAFIDPSQIDQILANLCVNARDAIANVGRITIETGNVTLDAAYCADHPGSTPGEFVMLFVMDDGHGMDRDTLDKIFEPFYTTKGVGHGTGLGLAMVYGIVKQNNGFIDVSSEPGIGSAFKIYLPRHPGEVDMPEERDTLKTPTGRGETVLLVEDEASILKLAELILIRHNYRVLTARSPSKAIEKAGEHVGKIALLITDVVMPEMNGRELADRLLSIYPDLKVLFMSGYTADIIVHRGVLEKGLNFIKKPFSMKELAVKTRDALDGK